MVTGFGEGKGLKVVTKAVNGVAAGQELWFSNGGLRETNGATYYNATRGYYWTSTTQESDGSKAYRYYFYSSTVTRDTYSKLRAHSIRCVR